MKISIIRVSKMSNVLNTNDVANQSFNFNWLAVKRFLCRIYTIFIGITLGSPTYTQPIKTVTIYANVSVTVKLPKCQSV